jgi:glyoxylase-like metal-dependent hydrolase (beta-lactamase superfamily II)
VIDTNTSAKGILENIDSYDLPIPEFVIVTHGHFDHFGGAKYLSK